MQSPGVGPCRSWRFRKGPLAARRSALAYSPGNRCSECRNQQRNPSPLSCRRWGIASAVVNFAGQEARVTTGRKVDVASLVAAVEKIGYEISEKTSETERVDVVVSVVTKSLRLRRFRP